nr:L-dopachrome tautomerase-related protein [Gluconobacter kondonii]
MIGVGVDAQGTVFASAPATIRRYSASVVRVDPKTGTLEPFPNASWNRFEQEPGKRQEWVSVPALWVDDDNRLWVLDSSLESVDQTKLPPKLVEFDPTSGKLLRSYVFDHDIKPSDSLNDVRVDTKARTAYISNEHGRGGLVVLNLDTGVYRLVLDKTPSGMADPNQHLHIYGELVRLMNGKLPVTQDDGIALSADRAWVYYRPLTDHKYWRISASILRDFHNSSKKIEQAVQYLGESVMSGGIEIDRCNRIWAGDLEHHSLYMLMLNKAGNGLDTTLIYHDPKVLDWADGFAISGEWLYISDSRLDQIIFRNKNGLTKQTAILRMRLPACEVQK